MGRRFNITSDIDLLVTAHCNVCQLYVSAEDFASRNGNGI